MVKGQDEEMKHMGTMKRRKQETEGIKNNEAKKGKKNHAGEKQNVGEKMLLSSLHFINFFKQ